MADTDTPERSRYPSESFFKIYYIASPAIPDLVSQEIGSYQGSDGFHTEQYWNHTIQETIRHHRKIVKPGGMYHPDLIMIIDRPDVSVDGVLVLNLNYHGYVDAVRREIAEAGDILGSLSILNTDWSEERDACGEETRFIPRSWFALYNLLPDDDDDGDDTAVAAAEKDEQESSFKLALKLINDGIGSPDLDSDNEEENPYILAGPREYYRPIESKGKNLDQIIAGHGQRAKEQQLDPSMFAVADSDWKDDGFLILKLTQTGEVVDSFRHRGYTAGEMLPWIFIGFMTWEEAKSWDPTVTSSMI